MDKRLHVPELMDDPALDARAHFQALGGLARINAWSRSAAIVWAPIRALARRTRQHSFRVLDIATGAGDIPIALGRKARRAGLDITIDGCDKSPQATEYATARARKSGASTPLRFFTRDMMREEIPAGYDIILCSLFLHHLGNAGASALLARMAQAAGQMICVNDLLRCRWGLGLAYAGTRIFSRSSVVHTDGMLSVRAAFTMDEVRALAREAGLSEISLSHRWPARFLLVGKK